MENQCMLLKFIRKKHTNNARRVHISHGVEKCPLVRRNSVQCKSHPSIVTWSERYEHNSSECNHFFACYIFIVSLIFYQSVHCRICVSAIGHSACCTKYVAQSYCRQHCCRSRNVDVFSRWSMHTVRNALEHVCVLGMSSRCRSLAVNSCPVSTCLCNVSKAHY